MNQNAGPGIFALNLAGLLVLGWTACSSPPSPAAVKTVEDCVKLFKTGPDARAAELTAKSLLAEAALLDEAVESMCACYEQSGEDAPHRDALPRTALEWVAEWDARGRPKYLSRFFHCFQARDLGAEGQDLAAEVLTKRLQRAAEAEFPGTRAVVHLLSEYSGDPEACVSFTGTGPEGDPLSSEQLLELFFNEERVNVWLASGLRLKFEDATECATSIRVTRDSEMTTVSLTSDGVLLYEKDSKTPAKGSVLPDFDLPPMPVP